jgi:hypothetical protein
MFLCLCLCLCLCLYGSFSPACGAHRLIPTVSPNSTLLQVVSSVLQRTEQECQALMRPQSQKLELSSELVRALVPTSAWSLVFVDGFDADQRERIRQRVLAILMSPPTGIKGELCSLFAAAQICVTFAVRCVVPAAQESSGFVFLKTVLTEDGIKYEP